MSDSEDEQDGAAYLGGKVVDATIMSILVVRDSSLLVYPVSCFA